jgi:hypothetical protein
MKKFRWPDHIKFDDTEADMREARRVWLENGGTSSDFLRFIDAYAKELKVRQPDDKAKHKSA